MGGKEGNEAQLAHKKNRRQGKKGAPYGQETRKFSSINHCCSLSHMETKGNDGNFVKERPQKAQTQSDSLTRHKKKYIKSLQDESQD